MTPPADKPMDRSDAVNLARAALLAEHWRNVPIESVWQLARAVLAMDEELRKAAESGKEKP